MAWEPAALSALIKLIQAFDLFKPKHKLDVGYSFADNPDVGNQIILRNIGDKPLILTYWELEWFKKTSFWKSERVDGESPDDPYDLKMESYSSHILQFIDANWFSTRHSFRENQTLYILLHMAGKPKPIRKLVWKCQ